MGHFNGLILKVYPDFIINGKSILSRGKNFKMRYILSNAVGGY